MEILLKRFKEQLSIEDDESQDKGYCHARRGGDKQNLAHLSCYFGVYASISRYKIAFYDFYMFQIS